MNASAPRRWVLQSLGAAALIFVLATGVLGLFVARAAPVRLDSAPVRGVRLGMMPESVRAGFVDGPAGQWSRRPACCGDVLEWKRAVAGVTPTRWARFEFHEGVLVAIRLLADAPAPAARRVEVTPAAGVETRPGADGSTHTTVLARGWGTHGPEVSQILATASSP